MVARGKTRKAKIDETQAVIKTLVETNVELVQSQICLMRQYLSMQREVQSLKTAVNSVFGILGSQANSYFCELKKAVVSATAKVNGG